MQILVAMGIQWGHGLSEYWGPWCQISWNIKVLPKINCTVKNKLTSPSSIISFPGLRGEGLVRMRVIISRKRTVGVYSKRHN